MAEHNGAQHWDHVYATKHDRDLSWHQQAPATSLRLIGPVSGSLLDVGAGTSSLPDQLLAQGWPDLTLIDVSTAALDRTRQRLGPLVERVSFIVEDLLTWRPTASYEVWHDRAVLHFLTDPDDRARYVELTARAVRSGGRVVIGGFAPDGPTHCSGLPTARRSTQELTEEFAAGFSLVHTELETHVTPSGAEQSFAWLVLRRH